jgi:hypothetical protein
MPSGDISDGWVIKRQPSRLDMLSKKGKASLAVDGGISASKVSVFSGHSTLIDVCQSRRDQFGASVPSDDTDSTDLIPRLHPGHARIFPRLWMIVYAPKATLLSELGSGTTPLAYRMDYQLVLISAQPVMDA